MQLVTVNKFKDFLDRVGWTFLQAFGGLVSLDWFAHGVNLNLVHQLEAAGLAAAIATIKVLIAQNLGKHNDGAAIPGGVIQTKKEMH